MKEKKKELSFEIQMLLASGMLSTFVVMAGVVQPPMLMGTQYAHTETVRNADSLEVQFADASLAAVVTTLGGAKIDFDVNRDGAVNGADLDLIAGLAPSETATTSTRFDLNKDGWVNKQDWYTIARYAYLRYTSALFDVSFDKKLDGNDMVKISQSLAPAPQGAYDIRHDFDANGSSDGRDWMLYLNYLFARSDTVVIYDLNQDAILNHIDVAYLAEGLQTYQQSLGYSLRWDFDGDGRNRTEDWRYALHRFNSLALYDLNGDGKITGLDTEAIAQGLQVTRSAPSYSYRFDFDGNGLNTSQDWDKYINYLQSQNNATALYDVDKNGFFNALDLVSVAQGLQTTQSTSSYSYRFDFDGNGLNTSQDWDKLLKYINLSLKQPSLLYDVNATGTVSTSDITAIAQGLQVTRSAPSYSYRWDFDGDGRNTEADWAVVRSYMIPVGGTSAWLDVTGDAVVNSADVSAMKSAIAIPQYNFRHDLNADGRDDQVDLDLLMSY